MSSLYLSLSLPFKKVIKADYKCHKNQQNEDCYKIRLYSLMILTHSTYNNPQTKSLIGTKKSFLNVLIKMIKITSEDMIQAIAKVIQNLSFDTDYITMQMFRDCRLVHHLTHVSSDYIFPIDRREFFEILGEGRGEGNSS